MGTHEPDARVGTQIAGRYELAARIGKGGMGVVYRGVHVGTGRRLAVKLLASGADDAAGRRFLREARIAASVSHPHLVEVIDVGTTEDGLMYLVLELLEGEPLDAHLRRKGRMRAEDALDALVPIIDALGALHEAGVLHRDVKPSNIFLSLDGTARIVPKLLDLGISKRLEPGEALTETGIMLGTPHYMSPEQARGMLEVGVGVDIWAMGVVLFETLTNERPFSAQTVPGLLHKIATERPPRIGDRVPDLPAGVASEIDRALAYEPSSRHASARDLADSLVEAATDAGWTLTCRMPAGPRISLEPSPAPHAPSAADLTPMLGSAGTPVLVPSSAAPPRADAGLGAGDTRDLPAPPALAQKHPSPALGTDSAKARPNDLAPAPSTPPPERADPTGAPAVEPPPRASSTPAAREEPTTSPSERLRQLTPSPLRYVLPAVLVLTLGAASWVALSSAGDPPPRVHESTARAATEPNPTPRLEPDAGVVAAVPTDPAPSSAEPAPTIAQPAALHPPPRHRARSERRTPEPDSPTQPVDDVPLGTNAAPIID